MKLAVERISDRRYTEIGHFLSAEKLAEFKLEVRVQIRRRLLVYSFVICHNLR